MPAAFFFNEVSEIIDRDGRARFEPEPERESEPELEPESELESELELEPESESESELESELELEPESELESEPEPEPGYEPTVADFNARPDQTRCTCDRSPFAARLITGKITVVTAFVGANRLAALLCKARSFFLHADGHATAAISFATSIETHRFNVLVRSLLKRFSSASCVAGFGPIAVSGSSLADRASGTIGVVLGAAPGAAAVFGPAGVFGAAVAAGFFGAAVAAGVFGAAVAAGFFGAAVEPAAVCKTGVSSAYRNWRSLPRTSWPSREFATAGVSARV